MSTQNEAHGDEDQRRELTERDLEIALEVIVETILDHGQWPRKGRAQFDLYDFLLEERDPVYAWEIHVAAMSSNTRLMEERIERERATIVEMLINHLTGSEMVSDLANQHASEDE